MSAIKQIWAREILDSRGIPTVEAACQLEEGQIVVASVPSGASTGSHEAQEKRDQDLERFNGLGVLVAVKTINETIGPALEGMDPTQQVEIDKTLIKLDGTENKTKLGANSILAVSLVVSKAGAMASGMQLFSWIYKLARDSGLTPSSRIPTPLFNMINGGLHGAGNLDFQEFLVIPASTKAFHEGLQASVEIYRAIGDNLRRRKAIHSVGDEGGYAPNLFTNANALEIFVESIKLSKYSLGRDVFLGLDVAANSFYKNATYAIKDMQSPMNENQMLEYYKRLNNQYKLAILEDPFHENEWESWKKLMVSIGKDVTIVGDDLLVTNPKRVQTAIKEQAVNGILVKPNQVGTITETIEVVKMAKDANWKIITSHRSGETNDTFIADFAVGIGSDYVKFGAPARGERVAKYNRLLTIEVELSRATQQSK